ncbi:MAG TPA: GreA/GreB family elongation factor [Acidimicrobiia bacterium]|nr:GreA/GreB family elongation factor [Candidatus Nanopelagicales bacterium]
MAITEQLETPRWAQPGKDPRLTAEGVALIEERIRDIEQRRLPELRPLLVENERDERDVAAFEALLFEIELWQRLLAETTVLEQSPEDFDGSVSLGVSALVRLPDGETWVTPVHPAEAFLDDERVSAESPLGSALLGKSPGDKVMVHAPRGAWECTIVSTDASLLAPNRQRD